MVAIRQYFAVFLAGFRLLWFGIRMATTYTQAVTTTVAALMRDRGLNPTSLSRESGVPRRAIDDAINGSRDWRTSHLEAIAVALSTDLTAMVTPRMAGAA